MSTLRNQFSRLLLSSATVILSACGSSGGGDASPLVSRAIDGYLVGSQVFCDDVFNGGTVAGGLLTCPASTSIARIRGGMDVGFDELASEDGIPFVGELAAPADLGYVTPLSTIALDLSTDINGYNEDLWDQSVEMLAAVFGEVGLDLSDNAAESIQLVRTNAKIHQVISSFSSTSDEYVEVMGVFSELVQVRFENGQPVPLDTDVDDTLTGLNDLLQISAPSLHKDTAELEQIISSVSATNELIDGAAAPDSVAFVALGAQGTDAIASIDRQRALITFHDYWYGQTGSASIAQFEDSRLVNGSYATVVDTDFDHIEINYDALQINEDISNARVSLGISITSTTPGDDRSLTLVSSDVFLSARAGVSNSVEIEVMEDGLLYVEGTSFDGVHTETSVVFDNDNTFRSSIGLARFDLRSARRKLQNLGFDDIMDRDGNFEITAVISGIEINEISGTEETRAEQFTIESGTQTVSGSGFRGFVTYERY